MARISLLFSLALVLAIGSVLAHPPTHKKLQKTLCPSTLSKVQAFPYLEVSSFVEKKVQFAPKTIAFKSLFSICKSYIDFLGGVKFSASRDVFHVVHVKFTLMTKAMVIAQAHIGVEGDLAVKLGKSYTVMAERFVNLLEMMSTVSAKYKFDANAKISASESAEIEKCVMKLKSAIRSYVKVISQCSTKFSAGKSIGFPTYPVGFIGGIAKQGLGYAGKIVGAHGQVGAGFEIGAKAKVGVQSEKFLEYGPITKPKGRVGVQGEVKVGGQVHAAGKAKVRAQVEAKVGGETGSGYYDGIMKYFGKGHFDAAGKAHVSGGSGFRPLSNPHKKHLD
ncbi:hypothetical protein AtNW77_Chr3g0189631 [Arabidopsis thaliana]|uniref:Uncharacterized protein n=3 Tax=Arabidopsis TaxID=3701 RepID=A0A178VH44_ARATH|nr:hypothetical protein ISN45_At03g030660 [Arabidopsis thaliana x Arabidopsis arenosa]KAG7632928.1 hypothetical protein ISN44_As03g030200 [Arabidopsis suecica]OAP04645.1 hypothetical protein AXX17_AT3G31420 [Arabidopsis thaliana]